MSDHHDQRGPQSVAALLQHHLTERGLSQRQLAVQSDVPITTIHRWLKGTSTRPYHRGGLLKVAIALRLRRASTSRLLNAAGYPSLDALASANDADELALLAHWHSTVRNNLPVELTSFVGREEEIIEVADLVCREDVHLVTLSGSGGSGKTRLAQRVTREVFDSFPDGVFWVPLGAVSDPRLVIQRIADAIDLRDVVDSALRARLVNWLRTRQVLLLLDNLEQIIECGSDVVGLLQEAPGLTVLVTSRIPLHVSGEYVWSIQPLSVSVADRSQHIMRGNSAVELFRQRAEAANPQRVLDGDDLPAVLEICSRLDGLPLAIELAAARTRDRDPQRLLLDFPSRLDLAGDGPRDIPQRQQTLRYTITWSVRLLTENARALLFRLAVFSGSWTEDAAAAVCDADDRIAGMTLQGLRTLQEASLIERLSTPPGVTRYRMLETIREYGSEQLMETDDEKLIRDQHVRYFLKLAESAPPYVPEARPDDWYEHVATDMDNLHAALAWASASDDLEMVARFTAALWPFWHEYLQVEEGRRWLDIVLARRAELTPALRAAILTGASSLAFVRTAYQEVATLASESLALWRQLGDHRGQALVLQQLGWVAYMMGRIDEALEDFTRELEEWQTICDPQGIAVAFGDLGVGTYITGDFGAAAPYLMEAERYFRLSGDEPGLARSERDRGLHALLQGDVATAIHLLQHAVERLRSIGSIYLLPSAVFYLGTALCLGGKLEQAIACYAETLRIDEAIDDKSHLSLTLLGFAAVAHRQGGGRRAAILCGASHAMQQTSQMALPPAVAALYEREVSLVHNLVGAEVFAEAFSQGAALTTTEAIAFAREGIPPEE